MKNNIFQVPKILSPLALFFLLSWTAPGQTLDEFREIWVKESREFLLNNQKPLPYLQSGFHHFSRVQDGRLEESLGESWEKCPIIPASPVPKSRKYESSPQFTFEETAYHNLPSLSWYPAPEPESAAEEAINPPRIRKPEYTSSNPSRMDFRFFGNHITLTFDRLLSQPLNQSAGKELVAEYWKRFQVANSNHLTDQLMVTRDRLGLNDWGYLQLVKSFAAALFPSDDTGANLLAWALMVRSGFDVRIGYNQLGYTLLYPASQVIYGVPSLVIRDTRYYIDKPIASFPLETYKAGHPGAPGIIHLEINRSLNFQGELQSRKIEFQWDRKNFAFDFRYNPEIIRYLEEYPQTAPSLFFRAPMSFPAWENLARQFKPILSRMKNEERAAFLQQFVQKSYGWRPYNDLFGYDRYMFPEELLAKEECNDKGKSVLFSWLVANLADGKCALLEYPGFCSVAIRFDQEMEGDNFEVNGRTYTIADPSFLDAPLGLLMKEFCSLKPVLTLLNDTRDDQARKEKIWKLATAFGAEKSNSHGHDFLIDESGNAYICGYIAARNAGVSGQVPTPFVAKFDAGNSLAWMVKFRATGRAFGLELKQLDNREFYLAGCFRGKLQCNDLVVETALSEPDLFLAQFNNLGEIGWITRCGLDQLDEDAGVFITLKMSRSGEVLSVQLSNEDERTGHTGFQPNEKEGLIYIASRYQTAGLDRLGEDPVLKPIASFGRNLVRLRQLGTESNIAVLSSVFLPLINPGSELSGQEMTTVVQEKSVKDPVLAKTVAKALPGIRTIRNTHGVTEILTQNGAPARVAILRIQNGARVRTIPLCNNDLKIDVINGVSVDTGAGTLPVNSFTTDLSAGNLLIDMGKEHLTVVRNLNYDNPK